MNADKEQMRRAIQEANNHKGHPDPLVTILMLVLILVGIIATIAIAIYVQLNK